MILLKCLPCILIIILLSFGCNSKNYNTKLLSLEKCKLGDKNYDRDNIIPMTLSSKRVDRKTSTISSNYTVNRLTGPLTNTDDDDVMEDAINEDSLLQLANLESYFTYRAYQLQRSLVRDLEYKLEKLNCTHSDIINVLKVFRLEMTPECYLKPGVYYVENIKVDSIGEVFVRSVMVAGKYAYDMEMLTKNGVISCVSIALEFTN